MSSDKFSDSGGYEVEKQDMTGKFVNGVASIENILVGNGFGLSHPELCDAFRWDMHEAFSSTWASILPEASSGNLECDLSSIRINILINVIKYYVNNLFSKMNLKHEDSFKILYNEYQKLCSKYSSEKFLSGRKRIFSLNCNPILYFEILRRPNLYFDGFVVKNDKGVDRCLESCYGSHFNYSKISNNEDVFLRQSYVACKMKSYRGIEEKEIALVYHLHGAWFILANENDDIRKLTFSSKRNDSVNSLFHNGHRPFVLIEDRWGVKKTLTQGNRGAYLEYCYDQLAEISDHLLVFGCSLEKDDHLLSVLKENKKLKTIYVTYVDDDNYKALIEKFSQVNVGFKKIILLKIGRSEIWE